MPANLPGDPWLLLHPFESGALVWREPALFRLRTVTRRGWSIRLSVFVLMLAWCIVARVCLPTGNEPSWPQFALIALLVPFGLAFWLDILLAVRVVGICKDGVKSCGWLLSGFTQQHWNRFSLKEVRLLAAGEPENPYGRPVMILNPKYGAPVAIGLLSTKRFEEMAERLRAIGYTVNVSDPSARAAADTAS